MWEPSFFQSSSVKMKSEDVFNLSKSPIVDTKVGTLHMQSYLVLITNLCDCLHFINEERGCQAVN